MTPLFELVISLLHPLSHVVVLICCMIAATHPAFRAGFILLAIAAALTLLVSCLSLVPQIGSLTHASMSSDSIRQLFNVIKLASLLSVPFYCVGFILLTIRVSSIPKGIR